jgi:hypothetical protein
MTAGPIEHCYWVVPGKFLAGEYPRNLDPHSSAEKIMALLASGITVFIDLTREDDRLLPYSSMLKGAVYHNFPIADVSIPPRSRSQSSMPSTSISGRAGLFICTAGVE